jgi:hypothetical protein
LGRLRLLGACALAAPTLAGSDGTRRISPLAHRAHDTSRWGSRPTSAASASVGALGCRVCNPGGYIRDYRRCFGVRLVARLSAKPASKDSVLRARGALERRSLVDPVDPAGSRPSVLSGVSCTSATACTAVGSAPPFDAAGGVGAPLVGRWAGSRWSIEATKVFCGSDPDLAEDHLGCRVHRGRSAPPSGTGAYRRVRCWGVGMAARGRGSRSALGNSGGPTPSAVSCVSATACEGSESAMCLVLAQSRRLRGTGTARVGPNLPSTFTARNRRRLSTQLHAPPEILYGGRRRSPVCDELRTASHGHQRQRLARAIPACRGRKVTRPSPVLLAPLARRDPKGVAGSPGTSGRPRPSRHSGTPGSTRRRGPKWDPGPGMTMQTYPLPDATLSPVPISRGEWSNWTWTPSTWQTVGSPAGYTFSIVCGDAVARDQTSDWSRWKYDIRLKENSRATTSLARTPTAGSLTPMTTTRRS